MTQDNMQPALVMVKNIPQNVNDEKLKEIFQLFGSYTSWQRGFTSDGQQLPFGFLQYNNGSTSNASLCCRVLHGMKCFGQQLSVEMDKQSRLNGYVTQSPNDPRIDPGGNKLSKADQNRQNKEWKTIQDKIIDILGEGGKDVKNNPEAERAVEKLTESAALSNIEEKRETQLDEISITNDFVMMKLTEEEERKHFHPDQSDTDDLASQMARIDISGPARINGHAPAGTVKCFGNNEKNVFIGNPNTIDPSTYQFIQPQYSPTNSSGKRSAADDDNLQAVKVANSIDLNALTPPETNQDYFESNINFDGLSYITNSSSAESAFTSSSLAYSPGSAPPYSPDNSCSTVNSPLSVASPLGPGSDDIQNGSVLQTTEDDLLDALDIISKDCTNHNFTGTNNPGVTQETFVNVTSTADFGLTYTNTNAAQPNQQQFQVGAANQQLPLSNQCLPVSSINNRTEIIAPLNVNSEMKNDEITFNNLYNQNNSTQPQNPIAQSQWITPNPIPYNAQPVTQSQITGPQIPVNQSLNRSSGSPNRQYLETNSSHPIQYSQVATMEQLRQDWISPGVNTMNSNQQQNVTKVTDSYHNEHQQLPLMPPIFTEFKAESSQILDPNFQQQQFCHSNVYNQQQSLVESFQQKHNDSLLRNTSQPAQVKQQSTQQQFSHHQPQQQQQKQQQQNWQQQRKQQQHPQQQNYPQFQPQLLVNQVDTKLKEPKQQNKISQHQQLPSPKSNTKNYITTPASASANGMPSLSQAAELIPSSVPTYNLPTSSGNPQPGINERPIKPLPKPTQPSGIQLSAPARPAPLTKWFPLSDTNQLNKARCKVDQKPIAQLIKGDEDNDKPLHIAVAKADDSFFYVQALLERYDKDDAVNLKDEINAKNNDQQTPLLVAALELNATAIKILISHDADPNITGKGSQSKAHKYLLRTPLQWVIHRCDFFPEKAYKCIQELLNSPTLDKEMHCSDGKSALYYVTDILNDNIKKRCDALEAYKKQMANQKTCTPSTKIEEYNRIIYGVKQIIMLLLHNGCDLSNKSNRDGTIPFFKIIESGDVDFALSLLKLYPIEMQRRLMTITNRSLFTCLHIAVSLRPSHVTLEKLLQLIEVMVRSGANPLDKNVQQHKPIDLCDAQYKARVQEHLNKCRRKT